MPRCTADEINFRAATHSAISAFPDACEWDETLAVLAAGLKDEAVRGAIRTLADYVVEDTDVELLFQPEWDGVETMDGPPPFDFANLHPRDWFVPFRSIDDPIDWEL